MREAGGRADVHTYTWAIYACSVGRDVTKAVQLLDDFAARVGMDDVDAPESAGDTLVRTTKEEGSSGGGGGGGVGTRRRRGGRAPPPPPPPPTRLYNTVLGMCGGGGGGREAAAEAEVRGNFLLCVCSSSSSMWVLCYTARRDRRLPGTCGGRLFRVRAVGCVHSRRAGIAEQSAPHSVCVANRRSTTLP